MHRAQQPLQAARIGMRLHDESLHDPAANRSRDTSPSPRSRSSRSRRQRSACRYSTCAAGSPAAACSSDLMAGRSDRITTHVCLAKRRFSSAKRAGAAALASLQQGVNVTQRLARLRRSVANVHGFMPDDARRAGDKKHRAAQQNSTDRRAKTLGCADCTQEGNDRRSPDADSL